MPLIAKIVLVVGLFVTLPAAAYVVGRSLAPGAPPAGAANADPTASSSATARATVPGAASPTGFLPAAAQVGTARHQGRDRPAGAPARVGKPMPSVAGTPVAAPSATAGTPEPVDGGSPTPTASGGATPTSSPTDPVTTPAPSPSSTAQVSTSQ